MHVHSRFEPVRRDPAGVAAQIPKMIESCGGELLASRLWNEQRLAYPIEGHRKGTYWLSYFRMDTGQVVAFNRACRLNENVVRNLTLKVEPRLVDTLVAHARGKRRRFRRPSPPPPPKTTRNRSTTSLGLVPRIDCGRCLAWIANAC